LIAPLVQTTDALPLVPNSNPAPQSNSQLRGFGGRGLMPPFTSQRRLIGGRYWYSHPMAPEGLRMRVALTVASYRYEWPRLIQKP
jgi:hypothetical protein